MDWKNRHGTPLADLTAEQVRFIIKTSELVKQKGILDHSGSILETNMRLRYRSRYSNSEGTWVIRGRSLFRISDV